MRTSSMDSFHAASLSETQSRMFKVLPKKNEVQEKLKKYLDLGMGLFGLAFLIHKY